MVIDQDTAIIGFQADGPMELSLLEKKIEFTMMDRVDCITFLQIGTGAMSGMITSSWHF